MARDPKKGDSTGEKRRGVKSAPRRGGAPRSAQKKGARKSVKAVAKPDRRRRSATAGAAAEIARLSRELTEALDRQTATADILKVIASSPSDVQPVFDAIAESAKRLLGSYTAVVTRVIDGVVHLAAGTAQKEAAAHAVQGLLPYPLSSERIHAKVARTGQLAVNPDADASDLPERVKAFARTIGWRSMLVVPMLRNDIAIGTIGITRREAGSFDDKTVGLLKTFADQAVIAIENARLFNQTKEALERQTATSDILKVIASSPSDVQPVFDAIAASARRVVGAHTAIVTRVVGDLIHLAAFTTGSKARRESLTSFYPQPLSSQVASARVTRTGKVVMYADTESDADDITRELGRVRGYRSVLGVPMLRAGAVIGTINVTRAEPGGFDENTIGLLRTFADQAVIAIENTRLFNETRETLARQTATADVLKVIASSPSDLQPVFDAIAERANELISGYSTTVFRFIGDRAELVAFTPVSEEADAVLRAAFPRPLSAMPLFDRISRGEIVETVDTEADTEPEINRNVARARGFRSRLAVPLRSDDGTIGFINVTRREPGTFDVQHVELLRTFADQAVIAIQNAQLFNETKEALARQTATADVLKVIASSPSNLQPVFDAIAERSKALIGAHSTIVVRLVDGMMELAAFTPVSPKADAVLRALFPRRPADSDPQVAKVLRGEIAEITDAEADHRTSTMREAARARGWRSQLLVPLKDDSGVIGWISITRAEVGSFAEKDVDLLGTFADQAVIAIQNARLINETREALERQTATADILKVIASSPDDVQPVFDAIAVQSNRLLDGLSTAVYSFVDDIVHLMSFTPVSPAADAVLKASFPISLDGVIWSEAVRRAEVFCIPDSEDESLLGRTRDLARARGWRSVLFVPLLKDSAPIGVIAVTRIEPGSFADHHVQLLKTFADQAVIAISNVELFQEVQQRTRELSKSLEDLRAAQDRLVQTEKLASLGQLTAGIAHEIKNPLNFVNNFAALSVELIDELGTTLAPVTLDEKTRADVGELTQMLKSNFEKVVQHGKRADSIVKNMLLHSREGSGERRSVDLNALVEESFNLAYHGARAERPSFHVTLKSDLDPEAGAIELYPQEMTRVLLNMISNGFYAVTKRAGEAGNGFEPTLQAATKGLPDRVEIRIRDNGIGIPPEVKEKMFNPFFTTKPAGEGTGLGLSMSHDIVVKQHGGTIEVETDPGRFTEFIIVLPRASRSRSEN